MRFKKSTFLVQKVHFFGSCTPPPKSILATGLDKEELVQKQIYIELYIKLQKKSVYDIQQSLRYIVMITPLLNCKYELLNVHDTCM